MPPELGAVHQEHLEESGRLGRDRGLDTAPFSISSWSDPKPGLPLYSLVSGEMLGRGRTGRSTAHRRGGGINKSTEMVLARSQEHEAVIEA